MNAMNKMNLKGLLKVRELDRKIAPNLPNSHSRYNAA
jgi:hypothetical protein